MNRCRVIHVSDYRRSVARWWGSPESFAFLASGGFVLGVLLAVLLTGCGGAEPRPTDRFSPFESSAVLVPSVAVDAGTDAAARCAPYAEADADPSSYSFPDPVPGTSCYTTTEGGLIYWCCR